MTFLSAASSAFSLARRDYFSRVAIRAQCCVDAALWTLSPPLEGGSVPRLSSSTICCRSSLLRRSSTAGSCHTSSSCASRLGARTNCLTRFHTPLRMKGQRLALLTRDLLIIRVSKSKMNLSAKKTLRTEKLENRKTSFRDPKRHPQERRQSRRESRARQEEPTESHPSGSKKIRGVRAKVFAYLPNKVLKINSARDRRTQQQPQSQPTEQP